MTSHRVLNLSGNPNAVPGVVVQDRLYPAGEIGWRNPPHAYHADRLTSELKPLSIR